MKVISVVCATCVLCAVPTEAGEPAKKPAPLTACIEPVVMRTEAAQLLPGSKKTVIVPAWEDDLGLSRLTKDEFAATGLTWQQFLTEASATAAAHLKSVKDRKSTRLELQSLAYL